MVRMVVSPPTRRCLLWVRFFQDSRKAIPLNPFFDYPHTVDPDEIDAQEHVHNLRYLQWTLWAAGDHSAAMGWDSRGALERGLGWVVRAHDITYRAAALAKRCNSDSNLGFRSVSLCLGPTVRDLSSG